MSCKGCNYYPPKKEDWPCNQCTDGNLKVIADPETEEEQTEETTHE